MLGIKERRGFDRIAFAVLILVATVAIPLSQAGAQSSATNWQQFGFLPAGGRYNPHETTIGINNAASLSTLWNFKTGNFVIKQ